MLNEQKLGNNSSDTEMELSNSSHDDSAQFYNSKHLKSDTNQNFDKPQRSDKAFCRSCKLIVSLVILSLLLIAGIVIGVYFGCIAEESKPDSVSQEKVRPKFDKNNPVHTLEFYQTTYDVTVLFKEFGVHYWATFGTLLGVERSKGIMPHDDDSNTDLAILKTEMDSILFGTDYDPKETSYDNHTVTEFRKKANSMGYDYQMLTEWAGIVKFYKIDSSAELCSYATENGRNWSYISVDFFIYDDRPGHLVECNKLWLRGLPREQEDIDRKKKKFGVDSNYSDDIKEAAKNEPSFRVKDFNPELEWHNWHGVDLEGKIYRKGDGWPSKYYNPEDDTDIIEAEKIKRQHSKIWNDDELCLPFLSGINSGFIFRARDVLPTDYDPNNTTTVQSYKGKQFPNIEMKPFGAYTVRSFTSELAEKYLISKYGTDVMTHIRPWDHTGSEETAQPRLLEDRDRMPKKPIVPLVINSETERAIPV